MAFRFAFLVVLLAVLQVPAAHGHVTLRSSLPAEGDTLEVPPEEIRLEFTGAVMERYTRATLTGPDGKLIETSDVISVPDAGRRVFALPVDVPLGSGRYTVQWRTAAADGHPVEGSFTFVLRVVDEVSPEEERTADVDPPEQVERSSALAPAAPLSAGIRLLHYVSLLALLGGVAFYYGVTGRMGRDPRVAGFSKSAERLNLRVMTGALVLLSGVIVVRLWAQSLRLHGPGEALKSENLARMLSGTTWGHGWLLQVGAAAVFLVGLLVIRRAGHRTAGWAVAAAAVLALSVVPALSGHAAAVEEATAAAVAMHSLHVVGGGVWLGTLAVLLLVGLPVALTAQKGERMVTTAAMVGLFSPVALTGAIVAGITGFVNAYIHFNSVSELWTTSYGNALLLKLAALAIAVAFGFYHWRYAFPRLHERESPRRFRTTSSIELAAGIAVLLATAVFVALPTPG